MHTSMRAIGPVTGGAEGLLDILTEYFTRGGGIDPLLDEKHIPQKWYCTGAPL